MSCEDGSSIPDVISADIPATAKIIPYEDIPGLEKAVDKSGGEIVAEGDLLNGVKHGSWTTYEEGLITSLTSYYKGKKQGVSLTFDKQGYVETKAYYHSDELDGNYRKYKRKRIIEDREYKNGVLQGMVKKYYDNGKLMEEAPYADGKLNGIAKWYDQEGNLSIAYEYEAGVLVDKDPDIEEGVEKD